MKTKNRNAWEYMEYIVAEARRGNSEAVEQIVKEFQPLINSVSNRIWYRYNRSLDLGEIKLNANHLIISLTLLDYDPNGSAMYGTFIKSHLHARLTQMFRPIATTQNKTQQIDEDVASNNPYTNIIKNEQIEIFENIMKYVSENCNDREKILIESMLDGRPRRQLAKEFRVAPSRVDSIYWSLIDKLRAFVRKCGIRRADLN